MKQMVAIGCVLALTAWARAEDKANPTGTWKYTAEVNGQSIDVTIKLKLDGDKLTGSVTALDTETKIEDGKYKDGEVSFTVNREIVLAQPELEPGLRGASWSGLGSVDHVVAVAGVVSRGRCRAA